MYFYTTHKPTRKRPTTQSTILISCASHLRNVLFIISHVWRSYTFTTTFTLKDFVHFPLLIKSQIWLSNEITFKNYIRWLLYLHWVVHYVSNRARKWSTFLLPIKSFLSFCSWSISIIISLLNESYLIVGSRNNEIVRLRKRTIKQANE